MEQVKKELQKGLVSVITANYNTPEAYLREAIDSVLAQTYSDFEFIIVDDASTDSSPAVIESYKDPRIRVVYNEKNLGLAKAMNKALELCRGEFVARMDTDDICFPQRLERQVNYLREHPEVIVCGTWAEYINERQDGKTLPDHCREMPDNETYRIKLLFGNPPYLIHPSVMFNHAMLLEYGIKYNEKYRYAQDYRMWVECAWHAECRNVPEKLLKFRFHNSSVSITKKEQQEECVYGIIQEQLDRLHLTLTDELKPCHWRLFSTRRPYDPKTQEWLDQLLQANDRYKVYDRKKFKKIIRGGRAHVCYFAMAKEPDKRKRLKILTSVTPACYPELFKLFFSRKKKFRSED